MSSGIDCARRAGAEEPAQPPADVAILATNFGASLVRWLAGLDADHQQIT